MIVGGLVVGAVIVAGWYVSGHLGYLAEDPATLEEKFVATNSGRMESYSFVAPVAYSARAADASGPITSRVAHVRHRRRAGHDRRLGGDGARHADVPLGRLRARSRTSRNHVVGGILMGFGGVTALGCTIGQGLSGHVDAGGRLDPRVLLRSSAAAWPRCATRCGGSSTDRTPSPPVNAAAPLTFTAHDHLRSRLRAGPPLRGLVRLGRGVRAPAEARLVAARSATTREVVRLPSAKVRVRAANAQRDDATRPAPRRERRGARRSRACPPEILAKLREAVRGTENVGRRFPEEARKIHYEEVPARAIRGQASREEAAGARRKRASSSRSLPPFLTSDTH